MRRSRARWLAPVALSLVALAAAAAQRGRPRVARPFFRLRLENAEVFEGRLAPLFAGLRDVAAARYGVDDDRQRRALDALLRGTPWPVELVGVLDPASRQPILGLWMPASAAPLLPRLAELTDAPLRPGADVACDGTALRCAVLDSAEDAAPRVLLEGVRGDQRLLMLSGSGAPASAELYVRSCERTTPSVRALREHSQGGDVGFVFDYNSLASSAADGAFVGRGLSRLLLGPRFAGLAGRLEADGDRLTADLWADVRPGGGWVGAVCHREPRPLALLASRPAGVTEFVAADVSVDGIVRLLRLVEGLGGGGAGDMHFGLRWLGELSLRDLLDTHLTGQMLAATEVGIETPLVQDGVLRGFAVGVGAFDGPRLLGTLGDAARRAIAADQAAREPAAGEAAVEVGGGRFAEDPALGPGVHVVVWRGELLMYVAAARYAVFFAPPDPAGAAMLRKCLATSAQHQQPVDAAPPAAVVHPAATMVGRGRILEHVTEAVSEFGAFAELGPVSRVLIEFLSEHHAIAEWELVVSRDGTRLHVEL